MQGTQKDVGFSLLEITMVITIIGLIIGGIFVGKDIMDSAERQRLAADLQGISSGFKLFVDKYKCIPGDCPNATTLWGKNTTLCNGHTGSAGTPGTCNGNNDGNIGGLEATQSLNQLALAELIPFTPTSNSQFPVINKGFSSNAISRYNPASPYTLSIGYYFHAESDDTQEMLSGGCESLLAFDKTFDDGKPNTGKIRIFAEEHALGETDYCVDGATNNYINTGSMPYAGIHSFYYQLD